MQCHSGNVDDYVNLLLMKTNDQGRLNAMTNLSA